MKKSFGRILALTLMLTGLTACDIFESADKNELQTLNVIVSYDYGIHIKDKVTTLLNGNFIWFNLSDYRIDELIAGDELIIQYTGEYEVQTIYPGRVNANKMHIQSIEVIEADIAEFTLLATHESSDLDLVPVDSKYNEYFLPSSNSEGYVVAENGSFKKYTQYSNGTMLYASLPKTTSSIRVDAIHDYIPRTV